MNFADIMAASGFLPKDSNAYWAGKVADSEDSPYVVVDIMDGKIFVGEFDADGNNQAVIEVADLASAVRPAIAMLLELEKEIAE
jgi:hypothetical protein